MVNGNALAEVRTQVLGVQKAANDFIAESQADMERGADLLHLIKQVEDSIVERKQAITKPLMASLASARDLFRPLEDGHAEAKKTIKGKMLAYQIAEEERIAKDKARIEARVDKGTMRHDTAIKKLESMDEVPKGATGSVGKASVRTIVKVRIVDESLIPREYLIPNVAAITEAVLRKNLTIEGVERYEEKQMVSR